MRKLYNGTVTYMFLVGILCVVCSVFVVDYLRRVYLVTFPLYKEPLSASSVIYDKCLDDRARTPRGGVGVMKRIGRVLINAAY